MSFSKTKTVFLLCNLYVSAVVGAGFATGQEVMHFFTAYGKAGFAGVLLAGILFMAIAPLVLKKAMDYDAYSMNELVSFRLGKKGERLVKLMSFFLEFAVLTVMLAGLRTLLHQQRIPNGVAVAILVLGLFLISFHERVALRMNNILTPIVILGITVVCSILFTTEKGVGGWNETANTVLPYPWWVSSLLYVGFNLFLAMPALCLAGKNMQKESGAAIIGGMLGGLCIGGMAMLSHGLLFAYGKNVSMAQMPIVEMVMTKFPVLGIVYQGILFFAMASSAVICVRCMVASKKKEGVSVGIICILAGVLCFVDFSTLVGLLYPVFGGVGILAVLLILW